MNEAAVAWLERDYETWRHQPFHTFGNPPAPMVDDGCFSDWEDDDGNGLIFTWVENGDGDDLSSFRANSRPMFEVVTDFGAVMYEYCHMCEDDGDVTLHFQHDAYVYAAADVIRQRHALTEAMKNFDPRGPSVTYEILDEICTFTSGTSES